jgi:hypothetical protein
MDFSRRNDVSDTIFVITMNSTLVLYTPIVSHVNCFSCTVHQLYHAQLISVVVALSPNILPAHTALDKSYGYARSSTNSVLHKNTPLHFTATTKAPWPAATKHIDSDIRAHFIRDSVNRRLVDVHHIPGSENPADLLTKPFAHVIHVEWIERIGMHRHYPLDN